MNPRKILYPTDFSPASQAVLPYATALALERDENLLIAHVEEMPAPYAGRDLCFSQRDLPIRDIKRLLRSIVPTDPQVGYEHRLVIGRPAEAILRMAERENVDLIVMGTHGRSGLARLLMGSVAAAVARRASCPVLTYRHRGGKRECAA